MDERIQKAFRQMFTDQPGEQAAAAATVVTMAQREGYAPSDLTLIHTKELNGQLYEQRIRLQGQADGLAGELAFLKDRASEQVTLKEALGWLATRKAKRDHWPELREHARRRAFNGVWPSEKQAYQMLARVLGVHPDDVRAWREGAVEVPEAMRQRVKTLEPGDKRKILVKKAVQNGKTAFGETDLPAKEHQVLQALLAAEPLGLHPQKIEEKTGILAKTVTGRLSSLKTLGLAESTGKAGFWRATAKAVDTAAAAEGVQ